MRIRILSILLLIAGCSYAQIPQVPSHMDLGDMKLRITPKGQEIIQEHVNALHKNQAYFEKMADKARLYFPTISKILYEEGVPDDFKYLCMQESGFQGDAVSTSNAVGFWQFKDFTAKEVGLYVEKQVDERKHLVYSTKGAAKYLKKNYFYLKNWIYTCQSYQQGLGGTQRSVDQSLFGVTKMTIDENTYWYVMKFLAHKVAYEEAMKSPSTSDLVLQPVLVQSGDKVSEIASKYEMSVGDFEMHNLWIQNTRIPDLRANYYVMVLSGVQYSEPIANAETITIELSRNDPKEISRISNTQNVNPSVRIIIKVNGKKAILANSGDSPVTLALRGGITKDQLLKYNDLIIGEEIKPDMVYYLQPKNNKSNISRHTTSHGESLWNISQKYGVKKKSIMKKNQLALGEEPKPGRVLFLRSKRPKDVPIEYVILKEDSKPKIQEIIETPKQTDSLDVKIESDEVIQQHDQPVIDEENTLDTIPSVIMNEVKIDVPVVEMEFEKIKTQNETNTDQSGSFTIHKVIAGETLYSISKKYEIKLEDLVEWNDLKNLSLSIGQEIMLKKN